MATNIELSPGAGGAKLATYKTTTGESYTPAAVVYMTDTTDNASVAQPVQVGHGLPVAQDGTWVVNPGDTPNTVPWLVSLNQGGNTAVVTAGGALTVTGAMTVSSIASITNPVTVAQSTPGNLLATVSIASAQTLATVTTVGAVTSITNPVTVSQGTPGNLLATVNIASAQTLANVTTVGTITNPVTVAQSTAANLLCTASLASGQTLATVTTVGAVTSITNPVTVAQSNAANLLATVNIASAQTLANVTTVGTVTAVTGITNPVTVAQGTASNLNATVSIAAAQTLATVTNVGTLATITNPVTVAQPTAGNLNCTATLAAGSAIIGKVSDGLDTSTIYNGTTALTPKFAKITASASGNTSVVALVSGKKIRVLRVNFNANGAVNVKFQSNTTDITGLWYLTQFASGGGGFCPVGLFETASGEALNINLSGAVAVGGILTYIEV